MAVEILSTEESWSVIQYFVSSYLATILRLTMFSVDSKLTSQVMDNVSRTNNDLWSIRDNRLYHLVL